MSGIDIVTGIFKLLNVPSVTGLLDGLVYKFNRPVNSNKRDIVISLPDNKSVDINIHVPNTELYNDQTTPDTITFKVITDAVLAIVGNVWNTGIPKRDADGSWYVNINLPIQGNVVDVSLIENTGVSDGYGGYTATESVFWTGKALRMEMAKGSQLDINVGRYEFNMRCNWLLPSVASPQKNMEVHASDGQYVINGIIPEWVVSTFRKDGDY